MRTTKQVLESIDEVLERPVVGCPTIHFKNEKPRKDYYDYSFDNQLETIITIHVSELVRVFDTSAAVIFCG